MTVPNKVIYGVEIRTTSYGDPAIGGPMGTSTACFSTSAGCPYDSLNVGLSLDPTNVTVGSNALTNGIFWATTTAGWYCDGGAGGVGTFRFDGGCWDDGAGSFYVPAVQFNARQTAITSPNHTNFTQGVDNTFHVTASGTAPVTYSATGALPSGVTFTSAGLLSGNTPAVGSFPLSITAHSTVSGGSAPQAFTLTVVPAAPTFTSATTTTCQVSQACSFTVTTTGAPAPAITGSVPPSGLALVDNNDGTATLSGTPTAGTGGIKNLNFYARSTSGHARQTFTLVVNQPPAFLSVAAKSGKVGNPFTLMVRASGWSFPTFTATGLRAGVTITNNGNGKATLAGHYLVGVHTFAITASNGVSPDANQTFTLTGK